MENIEFVGFPKMGRLSRDMIITEKIDGTNAQVLITESGDVFVGSRTRWITLQDDNYGFAKWVEGNRDEILKLGPGRHFGEWWGSGINRGYGLTGGEKRWSLFNVQRWALYGTEPKKIETADVRIEKYQDVLPEVCNLVPQLYKGLFDTQIVEQIVEILRKEGSSAQKGFMNPEGIVVFHTAGNVGFKKTILKDEIPKSIAK